MRILKAAHRAEVGPPQAQLKLVVAVDRERVGRDKPALGAERQAVEVLILREILTRRVGVAIEADPRIANGDRADFPRGAKIPLEQRGRTAERIGHIVEPVRRIVGWQQGRDVDVQPEQVADRIGVFRTIQPVKDGPAGTGMGQCCGVQLAFEPGDQIVVSSLVGPA